MPAKKIPPPARDLTLTCRDLAEIHGVSMATAYRWKLRAGIPMARGSSGVRPVNLGLWGTLQRSDWEKGYPHVAALMRVSRQAVHEMWKRLTREGHDLPKLKRGRPRKSGDS